MSKCIINIEDLEYSGFEHGKKFAAKRANVAALIGARKLGYGVIKLAPGKRAWPYHAHLVNEELFYVLAGSGTLRHADEEFPIRAGDFICAPPDAAQPHQIINTSQDELRYIALSSNESPDICLYPDSDKYGVYHANSPDPDDPDKFRQLARKSAGVDYWDGESDE